MNRRGFLGTLLGAAVAPFLPKPKTLRDMGVRPVALKELTTPSFENIWEMIDKIEPRYEHEAVSASFTVHPDNERLLHDCLTETERIDAEIERQLSDSLFGE